MAGEGSIGEEEVSAEELSDGLGERESGVSLCGALSGEALDSPAFPRDVTLTLTAPPWSRASDAPVGAPDAWTVDRQRRESLPCSEAVRPAPIARTRTPMSALPEADNDVFTLVGRARPSQSLDLVTEMTERFALGDFSGAMRAAELLLGRKPSHALALHYRDEAEARLVALLCARLEAGGRVPQVATDGMEIRWLGLDARVESLLPHIDGLRDYEAVAASSGLVRLEALRALVDLLEANVIRLV